MIWYKNSEDIVISTRIRLARNLEGVPFPDSLKNKEEIIEKIKSAVFDSNSTLSKDFQNMGFENMSNFEKQRLAEKHLISTQMLKDGPKACLINKDETMSIMIMEEDHIRQQVILGGYKLDEAFEICDKVDDVLSENLNFAFDENYGYLTSCPTNIGTGLRASVMLHLPGLSMTRRIDRIIESANNIGIAVRGFYGEGSKADGCFYQISNQVTMGATEKEILERVKNVTDQIVKFEEEARKELLKDNFTELTDKVYRSYGTLKYARSISSKEAIALLSDVLLGKNMGIIKEESKISPMECIILSAPGHIDSSLPTERDNIRAELLRNNI